MAPPELQRRSLLGNDIERRLARIEDENMRLVNLMLQDGADTKTLGSKTKENAQERERLQRNDRVQWKLCHDQWCKPGETSAVATILTSLDAAADERLAKLLAERFNEALELKELLTKALTHVSVAAGKECHAFGCMEIRETPTNDLKNKIEAILGAA